MANGKQTLSETLEENDRGLAREMEQVRGAAAEIWQEQRLGKFTAHGPAHIRQVERNLDVLTRVLQETEHRLRPHEIYVLLAACHLHDIGMQLDVPDAREKHAQLSYELILHSKDSAGRKLSVSLPIVSRNAREAIALVSRGHWTSHALALDKESFLVDNEKGRLRLLGLLLATADLLDLSPVRARYFRSDHRLDVLDGLGELHQTLHEQVHGCEIVRPDARVPEELRFEVTWHDENDEVRLLSDWALHHLTSYWRPMEDELYRESRGTIRWSRPWARSVLRPPRGPRVALGPEARQLLELQRAEQLRIDRDHFAQSFRAALEERRRVLFILPSDVAGDGPTMARWCSTWARAEGARAALLEPRTADGADLSGLASALLSQWQETGESLDDLGSVLTTRKDDDVVLVLHDSEEGEGLLEAFFTGDARGDGARIGVLVGARFPELEDVEILRPDWDPIARGDFERHLRESWGFDAAESADLARKAAELDPSSAQLLYSYARQQGRRWEDTNAAASRGHSDGEPGDH